MNNSPYIKTTEQKAYPRRWRLLALFGMQALFLLLIAVHYGKLMLQKEEHFTRQEIKKIERGPILDAEGRILAMDQSLANISLWKPDVRDIPALVLALQAIPHFIDEDAIALTERIEQSASDFLYIKKRVDQKTRLLIQEAQQQGNLPGVGIEEVSGRIYPEGHLAAHIIGYVGDDNRGLGGAELAFDRDLYPTDGRQFGSQLKLTINAKIQYDLEQICRRSMVTNNAESIVMLAMNSTNGEILAWVSLPDFDPNFLRSSTDFQRINRITTLAFEPGSVFKIFSLAAVLELGGIDANTSFYCDGSYERKTASGEIIRLGCVSPHGWVKLPEIIAYSCNVGTALAADRVATDDFYRIILDFGFGQRTGIGLSGESIGYLRSPKDWSLRSKPTIAFGQEIATSPIQIMQAATAIANEGLLIKPKFVKSIVAPNGRVEKDFPSEALRQVVSKQVANTILKSLEQSVAPRGTGRRANIEDVRTGVKTGTAQIIDPKTGTYSKTDYIASCIAFYPADKPELIIYQAVVKPKGSSIHGSIISAPDVGEAADLIIDYLGIERGKSLRLEHPGTIVLKTTEALKIGDQLPDFTGMSKKQLLPLFAHQGIDLKIYGNGWVLRQFPEAGTAITEGMEIILELE
jgi:cell division protein FtsI (penicillin-binding protein 3)